MAYVQVVGHKSSKQFDPFYQQIYESTIHYIHKQMSKIGQHLQCTCAKCRIALFLARATCLRSYGYYILYIGVVSRLAKMRIDQMAQMQRWFHGTQLESQYYSFNLLEKQTHRNFELAHQSQPILIHKKRRDKALLTTYPFNENSSPPWF